MAKGTKSFFKRRRSYKGRSKVYKTLSSTCGFTDTQIAHLIGIKYGSKAAMDKKLNYFFTYEKDYMTLNVMEIIGEAMVKKGLFEKNDDAVSYILYAVEINRTYQNAYSESENDRIVKYARGKMLERKTRQYRNELDVICKSQPESDFTSPDKSVLDSI